MHLSWPTLLSTLIRRRSRLRFCGGMLGEKNPDIAESDRDRMRLHCKRKLAELRSNGDPGGPAEWDQKVNKMVNIRKFEDAIVYMWLLQSSVSAIDAVDGFAMYAHCGAPRSKLASQPLGNATMAGAMSHPWTLLERPFRQLLVCRSFVVVCVIYFKTGMNRLHKFANSTTKFPVTILVSNVRDGQIFPPTPIGLNVWEKIEKQKQFIFLLKWVKFTWTCLPRFELELGCGVCLLITLDPGQAEVQLEAFAFEQPAKRSKCEHSSPATKVGKCGA